MEKYYAYVSIGALSSMVAWIGLRVYAQKKSRESIQKAYDENPAIGYLIVAADNQFISLNPSREAVVIAAGNLVKEYLPIIGFNVPSEESLVDFLATKLQVPTGLQKQQLVQILQEAVRFSKSENKEMYITQKSQELWDTLFQKQQSAMPER